MKLTLLNPALLCAFSVVLAGCATHQAQDYGPAFENMNALKDFSGNAVPVNIGVFSDINETKSITCRAEGYETLPNKQAYVVYIQQALKNELKYADLYSDSADTTLDARLNEITFSSAMSSAHWTIDMTFDDHKQAPYTVANTYHFSADFVADIACAQVSQAFMPAVQAYMRKLYADRYFQETLGIHG